MKRKSNLTIKKMTAFDSPDDIDIANHILNNPVELERFKDRVNLMIASIKEDIQQIHSKKLISERMKKKAEVKVIRSTERDVDRTLDILEDQVIDLIARSNFSAHAVKVKLEDLLAMVNRSIQE